MEAEIAAWIHQYGPWAVLVGAIFEGEATFLAAGYAVMQGFLPFEATILMGVLGGSAGDHGFYLAGRLFGGRTVREPRLRLLRMRAAAFLRRWGRASAFGVRFAYGLRVVLPASMGAARMPLRYFTPFNLLGAAAHAAAYLAVGYYFSAGLERLLGTVDPAWALVGIAAVGGLVWMVREWKLFHPTPGAEAPEPSRPVLHQAAPCSAASARPGRTGAPAGAREAA